MCLYLINDALKHIPCALIIDSSKLLKCIYRYFLLPVRGKCKTDVYARSSVATNRHFPFNSLAPPQTKFAGIIIDEADDSSRRANY